MCKKQWGKFCGKRKDKKGKGLVNSNVVWGVVWQTCSGKVILFFRGIKCPRAQMKLPARSNSRYTSRFKHSTVKSSFHCYERFTQGCKGQLMRSEEGRRRR